MAVRHTHNNPTPYTIIIILKPQLEVALAKKWTKQPYEEGIHYNTDSTVK
jgi:hypothetical protein